MDFNLYQECQGRTSGTAESASKTRIMNGALGLAGESGEVCDLVKKAAFQGHDLDVQKMKEELGDVLWYISETASGCGLKLDEIAQSNVEKLRRRYPDGFDSEKSKSR